MAHKVHAWRYFALVKLADSTVDICHRIAKLHEYKVTGGGSAWAVTQVGFNLDSEITRETAWQIIETQSSTVAGPDRLTIASWPDRLTIARWDRLSNEWFVWDQENQDWQWVDANPNPLNIPEHF